MVRSVKNAIALLVVIAGSVLGSAMAIADTTSPPPGAASVVDMSDPRYADAIALADARTRAEQRAFNSAAAGEQRQDAQEEFSDLSDSAAVRLARETFPESLTGPTEAAEDALSRGITIADYTSENTAQLVTATGNPAGILESTTPLTTDASADTGIDLSLGRSGNHWQPEAPRVDVTLPNDVSDPATVGNAGIAVQPAGADPTKAEDHADRLLYPSIDTDTDYILQPTEQGVESMWQLRSIDSPTSLRLHYTLPDGAALVRRVQPGGADQVAIVSGDVTIGMIQPVVATDAAHRPVTASMHVDGDDVVVSVDHRGDDVQHPVLVDPPTESWTGAEFNGNNSTECGTTSNGGKWLVESGNNSVYYAVCNNGANGLTAGSFSGVRYPQSGSANNSYLNFSYSARPNTYISDVTWANWQVTNANGAGHSYVGLYNKNPGYWQAGYSATNGAYENPNAAINDYSSNRSPTTTVTHTSEANENKAILGYNFPAPAISTGMYNAVGTVAMWIADGQPPGAPTIVSDSPAPNNITVGANGTDKYYAWDSVRAVPRLSVRPGNDIGLGIANVAVIKDDGTPIWGPYWFDTTGNENSTHCTGTRANACPTAANPTAMHAFYNLTPGADNTGRVVTTDAGGRYTFGTRVHVIDDGYGCEPGDVCELPANDADGSAIGNISGQYCQSEAECTSTRDPHTYATGKCSGWFRGKPGVPLAVKFKRHSNGRLYWDAFLTSSARAQFGTPVLVGMPYASIDGAAINPPYQDHLEPFTYDFHASLKKYQFFGGGGGTIATGQYLSMLWLLYSDQVQGNEGKRTIGNTHIGCYIPDLPANGR